MKQRKDPKASFWIRDQDSLGHAIDPRLIEAAERVWERVQRIVMRYLAEDTEAAEILEAAVDSASRAMHNDQSIQFFEAYLVRSVAREAIRRNQKNQRILYVETTDLDRISGSAAADLDQQLDDSKRVSVLRACMAPDVRTMFDMRVLGFDWQSIAGQLRYSHAHSAEVQFAKGIDRAMRRFRAHFRRRVKPDEKI
ncbi:MAG TPA: hypothetical protein VME17_08650 [Bryobacteraceae bacterium]|nr:hypothetical protein [Bryobacteraceae bacterium]